MRPPRVRLYIRVRQSDGRYSYHDPAGDRNRTLRANYALVDGKLEHHREEVHYLHFLRGGKRAWQPVGSEPDRAPAALRMILGHNTHEWRFCRTRQQRFQYASRDQARVENLLQEVLCRAWLRKTGQVTDKSTALGSAQELVAKLLLAFHSLPTRVMPKSTPVVNG